MLPTPPTSTQATHAPSICYVPGTALRAEDTVHKTPISPTLLTISSFIATSHLALQQLQPPKRHISSQTSRETAAYTFLHFVCFHQLFTDFIPSLPSLNENSRLKCSLISDLNYYNCSCNLPNLDFPILQQPYNSTFLRNQLSSQGKIMLQI